MADRADLVRTIPLFATLTDEQRESIERLFFQVERNDGDTIVSEGDASPVNFYVITAGEAVVSMNGKEVRRLGRGDYFGETALASQRPRSATVTAVGTVEMLAISSWNFTQLLAVDAGIREAMESAVSKHTEGEGKLGQRTQGAHRNV